MRNGSDPPLTITPMLRRHLDDVIRIEQIAHPTPWSRDLFEGELGRPDRAYLVARSGDQVLGYGGLIVIAGDGHVSTIAVDPDARGRGIGRRLLLELVDEALDRGVTDLTLEVRVSNEPALALYRRFGFAPAGVRRGYYGDGEDALVMWAHDIDEPVFTDRIRALRAGSPPVERPGERASRSGRHGHPAHPTHPARSGSSGRPAESGRPPEGSGGGSATMDP